MNIYSAAGYLGVPLFIILSGVLLLDPGKADESLTVFFKKRASRIAAPFVFWTVAYFAWAHYMHGLQLTAANIFSGLINGSYYHLWFIYLLIGLYCVTPVLRIIVKYITPQKFLFFLAIWFAGTVLEPFMLIFLPNVGFNPVMFVFTGWAGTFVLGVYLLKNPARPRTLYPYLIAGLSVAVIADGVAPLFAGAGALGFFHGYLSFNIIIASAALFLILAAVPATRLQSGNPYVNRAVNWVGKNSLGIYLVHIVVLETIEYGYLGLKINMSTLSPIVEIPLITALTLVATCALIYGLKKIPYVDRILG